VLGSQAAIAHEKGLVQAEWYTTPIDRKRLKELMKRKDWPGIRDTFLWFGSLIALGTLGYYTWGTWWALPVFIAYGVFYYSPGNSRWHECSHYTAFKTQWMNEAVYHIASFFIMRPGTLWRWEHARHHTDTVIVGRDPEIVTSRPPNFKIILMNVFNLDLFKREFLRAIRHSFKALDESEKDIIPATERGKVYWEARIYLLVYLLLIGLSIYFGSILPLMYIGFPAMYGAWLTNSVFFLTEHGGLDEDVLDHRMCTRTLYMNPVFEFLHWNMNYHIEHHMFPMVPYHALPAVHQEIKDDCPPPCTSVWDAMKEIVPVLMIQTRDPGYTILRPLPPTARPYSPTGPYREDASTTRAAENAVVPDRVTI
jgi:fatty acid desaturase